MIHRREISLIIVIAALALVLAAIAPGYYARENLSDLFLGNMPVLIVAIGTTLVILTGNIDISVGSVFAICGVVAGIVAKATGSVAAATLAAWIVGARRRRSAWWTERRPCRLSPDAIDRRDAGDDGGAEGWAAVVDGRGVGPGSAVRLSVVRSAAVLLPDRGVRHRRLAAVRRRVGDAERCGWSGC